MTKTSEKYCYDSTFPTRFRDLLDFNKVTQQKMAEICSVKPQSVSQWRNGETRPDILSLGKIAQYFNVSTDYLLGLSDIKSTDKATRELCSTLGLSEETIKVLACDPTSTIGGLWESLISKEIEAEHGNLPIDEKKELICGEIYIMLEGISTTVAFTFDSLIRDLINAQTFSMKNLDMYASRSLIDLLSDFFNVLESTSVKLKTNNGAVELPPTAFFETDNAFAHSTTGIDLGIRHHFDSKELLIDSYIGNISARLNNLKYEKM